MEAESQSRGMGARRRGARRAWLAGALAGLCVTAAAPTSALAELAPPTEAPPAAKRVCVKYRVVQTPSGPAARCVAHRTEVLGEATSGARSGGGAGVSPGATGGGSSTASGGSGDAQGRGDNRGGSPAAALTRDGAPQSQGSSSADQGHSSGGGGNTLLVAILAACAVAALLLVGLMRRPLLRLVGGSRT